MKCILCGNKNLIWQEKFKEWDLFSCSSCHLMFWSPLIFDPFQYKNSFRYLRHSFGQVLSGYHYEAAKLIQKIPKPDRSQLSILEVGCGNGSFFGLLSQSDLIFNYTGIDMNPRAVEYAKNRYKAGFLSGDFLSNLLTKSNYDIICFFEVLEHQINMSSFFDKIYGLLSEGGLIIGSVPNRDRYLIFNKREIVDFPPHHYTWWNKESLERLLNDSGFTHTNIIACNRWMFLDISLSVENYFLRGLKNVIKQVFFSSGKKMEPDNKVKLKKPLLIRLLNNKLSRHIRAYFMVPISIWVYLHYRIIKKSPARSLLFTAQKKK